jgi:aldose 1-epimerase
MALTGEQFHIRAGDHAATVVEVGGGLRSYSYGGIDVTAPYPENELPPRCDGGVLVPWPNRLRDGRYTFDGRAFQVAVTEVPKHNAIHGLARWARWSGVDVQASSVTMGIDLVPQSGWPFEVSVAVHYALDEDSGLTVTLSAHNAGSGPAPFGAGFHPYLSLHGHRVDDVVVTVPAARRLVVDDAQIPIDSVPVEGSDYDLRAGRTLGGLRVDDAFTELSTTAGRGLASVRSEAGGAQLWFDEAFGYLQVFTADDLAHGVPAVAIEPMTCPADAFNSGTGMIVLNPDQTWSASWGIVPIRH